MNVEDGGTFLGVRIRALHDIGRHMDLSLVRTGPALTLTIRSGVHPRQEPR